MKYAGFMIRGLALFIDLVLFLMVFTPITYLVKGVWLMTPQDHLWIVFDPLCAVFLVLIIAYYIFFEWLLGGTVGKLVLKLRILDEAGRRITFKQSVYRFLGRLVDGIFFNLVGIIIISKSKKRQRFGDKIAATVVVKS